MLALLSKCFAKKKKIVRVILGILSSGRRHEQRVPWIQVTQAVNQSTWYVRRLSPRGNVPVRRVDSPACVAGDKPYFVRVSQPKTEMPRAARDPLSMKEDYNYLVQASLDVLVSLTTCCDRGCTAKASNLDGLDNVHCS